MLRIRNAFLAGVAVLCMSAAAAQIVPQPDTPPAEPPPPTAPVVDPAATPQATMTSVSMDDLKTAFETVGLTVTVKTAPNGTMYYEARNNGDLVFGAAVLCAGVKQTDCKKVVLESGQMTRALSYEELTRFNTSGFASRVVTYDLKKKEPSLTLVVDLHGSIDNEFLPGQIRGLLSDMQSFMGQLQGRQTSGFSAVDPSETLLPGNFKGMPLDGPGTLQARPDAH